MNLYLSCILGRVVPILHVVDQSYSYLGPGTRIQFGILHHLPDLLDHVKGVDLQTPNFRICTTQNNYKISRRQQDI